MSAGIACNKLLAKVAAGLHKPDQQTIVPPRCAAQLAGCVTGAT
jgi:nucleotidyltransferase/DNA polymerase involved in DNA repair